MPADSSRSRCDASRCSAVGIAVFTTSLLSLSTLLLGLSMFLTPYKMVDVFFQCRENVNSLEVTLARLTGGVFVSLAVCCLSLVARQLFSLICKKEKDLEPGELDKCRSSLLCQVCMGIALVLIGLVDDRVASEGGGGNDAMCGEFKSAWLIGGGALYIVLGCAGMMFTFWTNEGTTYELDFGRSTDSSSPRIMPDSENENTVPLLSSQDPSVDQENHVDDEEEALLLLDEPEGEASLTTTSRITGTRRLLKLAAPQVFYLYIGCAVLLVRLPFSLSIPHFVSTTLGALGRGDFNAARMEILLLFILGTIDAALDFWCVFLFGFAKEKIVKGVRIDTFAAILRQEIAFFDKHTSGDLSSRLNSDCGEMAGDLTWFFRFSIESVVRIAGITMYMLIRSPLLGACALSIVPVVAVVNKKYGDWLRKNAIAVQNALAVANSVAQEALSCVRTVIGFAAEAFEYNKYCERIEHQYRLNVKQLYMTGVYYMVISTFLINTCVQAALLLIGTALIQRGKLTPEVLLAFMLYQGQLQNETLNLFQSYSSLIKSSGAGDKVFSLLDRTPPPPGTGSPAVRIEEEEERENDGMNSSPSDVRLRDVHFFYPSRPSHLVLKGLSLDIPAGSTVALVGSSGCGKSTVIGLLQRLYDPSSGGVFIDGSDLRSLDIKSHRRHISTVSQDPVLFSGTISSNIAYGIPDATQDDIIRAATLANAHNFISNFPRGYHTEVGERGVQLSGGQKQRIAIARAVIKNPSLLLLDEATSALDAESEHVVQEALDHLLNINNDMTTVVVAHRLRTVRDANCIAFIEDGRVVEKGTHDELMELADGRYRKMVARAGSNGLLPDS